MLRSFRFGESKLITDFYTEEMGRLSVIANAPNGSRKRQRSPAMQPLSIVELECDVRQRQRLQKLREVRLAEPYTSLPFDASKLSIGLFVAEFLCYALRGEQKDRPLFAYVEKSLRWLDGCATGFANFHLVFLMRISRFLGFYPNLESDGEFFDLRESTFTGRQPLHRDYLQPEEAGRIRQLMRMDYTTMHLFAMSRQERNRCVEVLLLYYKLHLPDFPDMRSLPVLRELF